jgi:hypothetical protein
MKRILLLASILSTASPALATGGFDCRSADGGIALAGTVGHTIVSPLVGARLTVGERTLSTIGDPAPLAIGRSWIDEDEIRVDLVDPQAMRVEAALRVVRAGRSWTGTLIRDGTAYPVRCVME